MAYRKPLFMSGEGFAEEMALTDDAQFGELTLTGNILMGGNKIVNLAQPTNATDAANKEYVDAVASGLNILTGVVLATAAPLAAVTAAGSGVGKTLTENANGALTVDGVLATTGERILVKDQVTGSDDGIYVVTDAGSAGTPFILTRSTDFDQTSEALSGSFVFVDQGTTNANTGWVLQTDNPITVDTTAQLWTQFSAATSYTFDQGLIKTISSVKVDLDTAAAAQTAGAGGGSSGLEFDANTAAGKLRVAVNATGGIDRSASGLEVLLNGTTLLSGASGLSVKGLPLLFEIATVATSANVTAANLGTLTAGPASDASGLHFHPAAPATQSLKVENSEIVVEAIAVSDPVYQSPTSGEVGKGRADTDAKSYITGLAITAQPTPGSAALVVALGPALGVLTGATPGTQYYLGATGGLSTSPPGAGKRVISMGFARTATDLWVRITDYGKKAA